MNSIKGNTTGENTADSIMDKLIEKGNARQDLYQIKHFKVGEPFTGLTEEQANLFRTHYLGKWVNNCYIFTTSYSVGINKLYEIAEEKIKAGILRVRASKSSWQTFIEFEDGETWMIKNPNVHLYGLRWNKCFVDAGHVTLTADHQIKMRAADPEKIDENLVYFNW